MSSQKSLDSDYHPHEESEESRESRSDIEDELDEEESVEEVLQDAQGWPEVSEIEQYLASALIPETRKKAARSCIKHLE